MRVRSQTPRAAPDHRETGAETPRPPMVTPLSEQNKSPGRRGRPTRDEAGRIAQQVIDVATRLFSERGFEPVSVDLIATTAGISKQTFYSRFPSKELLIAAVIRHGVNDLLQALALDASGAKAIDARLIGIATELIERSIVPAGISLDRLVLADAPYAPQLALAYYENAFIPARDLIAAVFTTFLETQGDPRVDPFFVAEQFLHAVVGGPARIMILTGTMPASRTELAHHVGRCVHLFLDGCRRQAGAERGG